MFKKSFYVFLIEVFGALLGLFSLYFVVGDLAPEVYSLVGVHTVIGGLMATFSDLGIETVMMREVLYWKNSGQEEKISEYATQAICSRIVSMVILIPLVLVYVLYLSRYKYDGQYLPLFLTYILGGVFGSLNNSMVLIIRANGGYVFSQLARTVTGYAIKFIGLMIFFLAGDIYYLFFIGLAAVPLTVILFSATKKYYKFRHINFKKTIGKIWNYRMWWIKTDFDYFRISADAMLVSAVFPATIMGSYSVYKTLESMSKSFIEGFFDVLSQDAVKDKGNAAALKKRGKKIRTAAWIVIGALIAGTILFACYDSFFVHLLHLDRYESIGLFIVCVAIGAVIHLLGKYEINMIAFFGSAKMNLCQSIVSGGLVLLSFVVVVLCPREIGVFWQRIISYSVATGFAIIQYQRYKARLYTLML